MGILGRMWGKHWGGRIGKYAGKKLGRFTGMDSDEGKYYGEKIGAKLGGLIPFKKGGPVKKTIKALLHKGEYVLPKGVKPTPQQRKAVSKRRKRC